MHIEKIYVSVVTKWLACQFTVPFSIHGFRTDSLANRIQGPHKISHRYTQRKKEKILLRSLTSIYQLHLLQSAECGITVALLTQNSEGRGRDPY
jgi:hypothetical protein